MLSGCIIYNGYYYPKKIQEQVQWIKELFAEKSCHIQLLPSYEIKPLFLSDGSVIAKGINNPCDFILYLDKDTRTAQLLEKAGYKLYNSAQAITSCDDKALTYLALSNQGISMAKTIPAPLLYEGNEDKDDSFLDYVGKELGFPMVVKENFGSYGAQVYLAKDFDELKALRKKLKERPHIYQQFISESAGRDIRAYVLGGKLIAAMLRRNPDDFRANISFGGIMEKVFVSEDFCVMAEQAAKLLNLDYCGVDILFGKDKPILCEINSNAHFKNIYDCTGINVAKLLVNYIIEDRQKT